MTYLPRLIKNIDDFYSAAESLTKKAVDWKEYLEQEGDQEDESAPEGEVSSTYANAQSLISELKEIKNADYDGIIDELELTAEVFKAAMDVNGGFKQLQKVVQAASANIYGFIDDLYGVSEDDKDELREKIDDVLDAMNTELRTAAKTSILQQADEATATKRINAVRNAFLRKETGIQEEADEGEEERGEEEEEEAAREAERGIRSPSDLLEQTKPGTNVGRRIIHQRVAETPEKYTQQIKNLAERLEYETDPATRKNGMELAQTLADLIQQMKTYQKLEDDLKIVPEDVELRKQRDDAYLRLEALRKQRISLKRKLNTFLLTGEKNALQKRMQGSRNEKEKAWLQAKIDLLNLRMNPNLLRKGDEIVAREALINMTGILTNDQGQPSPDGDYFLSLNLPPEQIEDLKNAVQAGNEKIITKAEYDRVQSVQQSIERGKQGPVPTRQKGRRGGGSRGARVHNFDFQAATWEGRTGRMLEKINTATHVSRLAITQFKDPATKKKVHNALKPFVDAVKDSIQDIIAATANKDEAGLQAAKAAKYEAIKLLKAQLTEWSSKEPAIRVYEKNVRLLPHFKRFGEEIKKITEWYKEGVGWQLDEAQRQYVLSVITDFDQLVGIYQRFYQGRQAPKTSAFGHIVAQLDLNYNAAILYIAAVLNEIEFQTGVSVPVEEPAEKARIEEQGPQVRVEEPVEETDEPVEKPALKTMKMSSRMNLLRRIMGRINA